MAAHGRGVVPVDSMGTAVATCVTTTGNTSLKFCNHLQAEQRLAPASLFFSIWRIRAISCELKLTFRPCPRTAGVIWKGAKINTVTFTRQLPGNSSGAAVSVAINRDNVVSAEKNEDGSVMIKMIDGPEIYVSDPWDTVVEGLFL
jgi:hypothetical protein